MVLQFFKAIANLGNTTLVQGFLKDICIFKVWEGYQFFASLIVIIIMIYFNAGNSIVST